MYVNSAAQSLARGGCTVTLLSGLAEVPRSVHSERTLTPGSSWRGTGPTPSQGQGPLSCEAASTHGCAPKRLPEALLFPLGEGPGTPRLPRPDPTPPRRRPGRSRNRAAGNSRARPRGLGPPSAGRAGRCLHGGGTQSRTISFGGRGEGKQRPSLWRPARRRAVAVRTPRLAQRPGRLPGLSFPPALGPERGRGRPRAPHPTSPELGAAGAGGRGRGARGGRGRGGGVLAAQPRTRAHRRGSARRGYSSSERPTGSVHHVVPGGVQVRLRTARAAASRGPGGGLGGLALLPPTGPFAPAPRAPGHRPAGRWWAERI